MSGFHPFVHDRSVLSDRLEICIDDVGNLQTLVVVSGEVQDGFTFFR